MSSAAIRPPSPRISVVVLTHNRVDEVVRTVAELRESAADVPLIVVDNGSVDGTAGVLARTFPAADVIALPRNIGAAARNAGAERAATPYVAFSDDDCRWSSSSLARAVEILDRHPGVAVLSARVLVGAGEREDPACTAMAGSPFASDGLPGRAILGFMAGASVFRREAFFAAGGFEPRFLLGAEEGLLALELASLGWKMVYCEALTVRHLPSTRRDSQRRLLIARNMLWTAWLRRRLPSAVWKTREVLRALRDGRVAARTFLAALAGLPWVLAQRRVIPDEVEAMLRTLERR